MDEILIEEKKYVSSKRAAEMTGYAKDYVGQLCREGRVQARLIGRGWYVLESAIQDHRFGNVAIEPEKAVKWESPHYKASSEELLPSTNRIKDTKSPMDAKASADNQEKDHETSQRIQDSWKAWFDRFDHMESIAEPVVDTDTFGSAVSAMSEEPEKNEKKSEIEEDTNINVPIHTMHRPLYQSPPEELLPHNLAVESLVDLQEGRMREKNKGKVGIIQVSGILLAMLVVALAVIGSGYFDEYIISNSQARIIAGMELYNK